MPSHACPSSPKVPPTAPPRSSIFIARHPTTATTPSRNLQDGRHDLQHVLHVRQGDKDPLPEMCGGGDRRLLLLDRPPEACALYLRLWSGEVEEFVDLCRAVQAWSTHKLVCGSKSNPFTLPPLTDEEADLVWTHRRFASEQITMITMGALPATPLKLLEARCAVKEDGMRVSRNRLCTHGRWIADASANPRKDVLSALSRDGSASQDIEAQRFELLCALRVYIFCQHGELLQQRRLAMGDAYTRPQETTTPIQSLSMKLIAPEWQAVSEVERKKRWFSELSHRLLAYAVYARVNEGMLSAQQVRDILALLAALRRYIRSEKGIPLNVRGRMGLISDTERWIMRMQANMEARLDELS